MNESPGGKPAAEVEVKEVEQEEKKEEDSDKGVSVSLDFHGSKRPNSMTTFVLIITQAEWIGSPWKDADGDGEPEQEFEEERREEEERGGRRRRRG